MTLVSRRTRSLSIRRRNFLRKPRKLESKYKFQKSLTMQQSSNSMGVPNSFKQSQPQNYRNKPSPKMMNTSKNYKKSSPINIAPQQNTHKFANFTQSFHNYNHNSHNLMNFDPANTVATLAQIIRNELTINLTKDEPRLVMHNSNSNVIRSNANNSMFLRNKFNQQSKFNHNLRPFQLHNQFAQLNVNNKNGTFKLNKHGLDDHYKYHRFNFFKGPMLSTGAGVSSLNKNFKVNIHRYPTNRFKYIKPNSVKNNAPYNTTQYIMYDYSKRTPHDQVCPNEQQQFCDEWNFALANSSTVNSGPASFSLSFVEDNEEEEDELEHKECGLSSKDSNLRLMSSKSEENLSQPDKCNHDEDQIDHATNHDTIFQFSTSL